MRPCSPSNDHTEVGATVEGLGGLEANVVALLDAIVKCIKRNMNPIFPLPLPSSRTAVSHRAKRRPCLKGYPPLLCVLRVPLSCSLRVLFRCPLP